MFQLFVSIRERYSLIFVSIQVFVHVNEYRIVEIFENSNMVVEYGCMAQYNHLFTDLFRLRVSSSVALERSVLLHLPITHDMFPLSLLLRHLPHYVGRGRRWCLHWSRRCKTNC